MQSIETGVIVTLTNQGCNVVYADPPAGDDRQEFVDTPRRRRSAPRGALTGMLIGVSLWGTILVLAAGIKV